MMEFAPVQTTLEPQDLEFLQGCFDTIRRKRGLDGDNPVASHLAAQMIELYQAGVRDPHELNSRMGL
ncbi:hypothetical protein [Rhizobium sp. SAFR-030]|uniref:hypothetical protein n=1 Tax=Rhizobium sp. SAFR-030 TaxID=3387277 RepID=UPI003F7D1B42